MTGFLKQEINWNEFELFIDSKVFNKEIVLKAAYSFLDKWYFFFKLDDKKNIILQFNKKDGIKEDWKKIIWDFSWELLNVYLRDKIEKDNKIIRERIISSAINNALDYNNFVSIDTDNDGGSQNNSSIDFDKDIDEILREIENDPDLKIDQEEIDRILKEIEEESEKYEEPKKEEKIIIDPKKVKNAKKKFQDR